MEEKIKEIIYAHARKGTMCDEIEEGQIIGLKTGKGQELDMVAIMIKELFTQESKKDFDLLKRMLQTYSVNAPETSRTATFTPEQFMEVYVSNLLDKFIPTPKKQ